MSWLTQSDLTTVSSGPFSRSDRILIVDDEPRLRSSLRILLASGEREILESESGLDAIGTLKGQEIDLVLLNIGLPDISGLEVMEWISSQKIPTNVIIVSGDNKIDSAIFAMQNGALGYVLKPYDTEDIQLKVNHALQRRNRERNQALMNTHLEHSEELHRFLVDQSPNLVYTLNQSGRFTYVNSRFESLLGFTKAELIGSLYTTIVHDEDIEKSRYAFIERRRDERATANLEMRLKCKNISKRNHIVAMMNARGIYDDNFSYISSKSQRFIGTYGVSFDITERKIAEEAIAFQAFHDQLTRLPNQRLFKDRLEMAINHSKRHGGMMAVVFIDLDCFKNVNDAHGHGVGDDLLKTVADRLRNCIRAEDTLARIGGDEFAVLLPELSHVEDVTIIAEKIIEKFTYPFGVDGRKLCISASMGIAVLPRDGESADSLLKHADIAMYKVKENGKNGFQFFHPEMKLQFQYPPIANL